MSVKSLSKSTPTLAPVFVVSLDDAKQLEHDVGAPKLDASRPAGWFGIRHLQAGLMFLGMLVAYSLRINLSVAIVAMVDRHRANPDFPEYDWDVATQSVLLSSFFWGYFIMQFPGGPMAERFGPKPLLVIALSVASLATIATPFAAEAGGWVLVCVARVIIGLSQGFMFPSFHNLLAHWTPAQERGRLVTFTYAGAQLGTIISLPLCGVLTTSPLGWPSAFYLFGGMGLVWAVLWFFLGANSPAEHPSISDQERRYIEASLDTSRKEDLKNSTPWKSIATSLPMWAVVAANCGHSWGFWTLMTEMPTYMKTVLGFDLKQNGVLSALPYLVMFLLSFGMSWASDFVNQKKVVSLTTSRKIFNSIGQWGPACALVLLAFTHDTTTAIVLLTVAVGINSAHFVGFNLTHIDMAPNYAGTLVGLSNGAGNIMSLIGPLLVGAVVTEPGSESQWRIVFLVAAGIYFLANLTFVLFATAELQPWNTPKNTTNKTNNNNEPEKMAKRTIDVEANVTMTGYRHNSISS